MADFVTGDELDDLCLAIEEDLFWEDEGFNQDMDNCVSELSSVSDIKCNFCEKKCKSQRGLSRHVKSKHHDTDSNENEPSCN